jgi:hypothetical protein
MRDINEMGEFVAASSPLLWVKLAVENYPFAPSLS